MSLYRSVLLKRVPEILGMRGREIGNAMLALAIGVFAGIGIREACDHGIVASAALSTKLGAVAVWGMLCDLVSTCGEFLQYVFGQRSH